jgi:XTP/dITP diphosphohydrolase
MLNFATANADKMKEIAEALSDTYELRCLKDFPELAEPIEDGSTLEENALIKARALYAHTGELSIADDTGLMVHALGGEPGVYSARWAGETCSYEDNVRKMIARIASVHESERSAHFETVIAIVGPNDLEVLLHGVCEGVILDHALGTSGFGYDPIFFVPSLGKSFAEMTAAEKNVISHRGKAVRALKEWLEHHSC